MKIDFFKPYFRQQITTITSSFPATYNSVPNASLIDFPYLPLGKQK
jgi:hypothetical protein